MTRLLRSLLLLVGLAALPACATVERRADLVTPPAPQERPAPAPAAVGKITTTRSIVVHFDKNSDDIRAGAMQTLYGAAVDLRGARLTSIRVTGYADAAGKRAYNQKLSQRRAAAVAEQLRKLGIAADSVTVTGAGETKGGARHHAEDRRVEIVFEQVQETAALGSAPQTIGSTAIPAPQVGTTTVAEMAAPVLLATTPPPATLRSNAKQAIKRVLVLDGTTWLPPPVA